MSREEATKIVDKVKIYRQSFLVTNDLYREWHRILEPYDYKDVDEKLDDFFKNGDNFGRYPDVYYLIKYLKKHDEKLKVGIIYVKCQNCQETIEFSKYDEHFERCNSADYLCLMSKKYFDKALNKQKMLNVKKEDFEKYYWDFCNKLFDIMDDSDNKHLLKNSILAHDKKIELFNSKLIY